MTKTVKIPQGNRKRNQLRAELERLNDYLKATNYKAPDTQEVLNRISEITARLYL